MVNQNDPLLYQQIVSLQRQVDTLEKLVNIHMGIQQGAISTNLPHPALSAISRGGYTVTNPITLKVFDTQTVFTQNLAQVVGTIIADLQAVKILGSL